MLTAFDLTQYVCERLQPDFDTAKAWLARLVDVLAANLPPADRYEDVAAAILILLACDDDANGARRARAHLLRMGCPLSDEVPTSERVQGFQSVLIQKRGFVETWNEVRTVRTFPEQTRAYVLALKTGRPSMEYGDLPKRVPEEWPVLQDALTSPNSRTRIWLLEEWSTACPRCHITLPIFELSKLRTIGIATAKNCCHRILIYQGG